MNDGGCFFGIGPKHCLIPMRTGTICPDVYFRALGHGMICLLKQGRPVMSDFTILLVDDSALMRRLVREMLRALGHPGVIEAADGGEALCMLERQRVDLVVSDWNMQPMDGLRLMQAMRAHPRLSTIPFAMMTGEQTPQTIAQAVAAGVTAYLTKPFSRDQLGRLLARLTNGPAKAA